jgi:hypothetical protein
MLPCASVIRAFLPERTNPASEITPYRPTRSRDAGFSCVEALVSALMTTR